MITIVSSTTRPNSNTVIVSKYISNYLKRNKEQDIKFIDLANINIDKYDQKFML